MGRDTPPDEPEVGGQHRALPGQTLLAGDPGHLVGFASAGGRAKPRDQILLVQSPGRVRLFSTPRAAARQPALSSAASQSH